jgi:hypothetical protein
MNGGLDELIDALVTADQAEKLKAQAEEENGAHHGRYCPCLRDPACRRLVAVPTETVYGLCCNGLDSDAVRRVYEVKGRPEIKPLSFMVPGGRPWTDTVRMCRAHRACWQTRSGRDPLPSF